MCISILYACMICTAPSRSRISREHSLRDGGANWYNHCQYAGNAINCSSRRWLQSAVQLAEEKKDRRRRKLYDGLFLSLSVASSGNRGLFVPKRPQRSDNANAESRPQKSTVPEIRMRNNKHEHALVEYKQTTLQTE